MKKLAVFALVALAAALALIPPADAQCRRAAVVSHHAVVVETPVVATTFLAVPVPVYPLYGVGYGAGAGSSDTAAEIRALTEELARLRQQLGGQQQPTPPPASPGNGGGAVVPRKADAPPAMPREESSVTPSPSAPTVAPKAVAASCIRCHGTAAPKGGVSLAGDVPQLVRLKAFRAAATNKMPPGGPAVSDADLEELARWSE